MVTIASLLEIEVIVMRYYYDDQRVNNKTSSSPSSLLYKLKKNYGTRFIYSVVLLLQTKSPPLHFIPQKPQTM